MELDRLAVRLGVVGDVRPRVLVDGDTDVPVTRRGGLEGTAQVDVDAVGQLRGRLGVRDL